MAPKPQLKPHQARVLDQMHHGCVLTGGVGSGKTITSLFYFFEKECGGKVGDFGSIKKPMDLYVFTTALKRDTLDWQEWAQRLGINRERDASVAGIQLTVDSYNNIGKYTHVHGAFLILDEQRMVGSGAWTKAFLHMAKSNRWIMLSATPGDVWEDYIPLFIANGFYKNRTEFKREHCVYSHYGSFPKLERYLNTGRLVRLRNSILVEMPFERHTKRHLHTVPVEYDKKLFDKVVKERWHVYEDRPLRDVSELFSVMRKVVNSDPSRLESVRGLLEKHPRLIVFYNFDYELEQLRTLNVVDRDVVLIAPCPTEDTSTLERSKGCNKEENLPSKTRTSSEMKLLTCMENTDLTRPETSKDSFRSQEKPWMLDGLEGLTTTSSPGHPKPLERSEIPSGSKKLLSEERPTGLGRTTSSPTDFVIAEWNGHKHDPLPTSKRWVYLVQYVAGSEGWNCVETDAVCFYSLTYSYKNFEQGQGRIDRLDTPFVNLHYYILKSSSPIDNAVAKALKNKKNFNEKDFVKK